MPNRPTGRPAHQLDLFGDERPAAPQPPRSARDCPPPRPRRAPSSARPEVAADVLAEVRDGWYGLLDDGDRYVVFEDDDRVRLAADDTALASLMANGYLRATGEVLRCRHGVVNKPVTMLRLTKRGHTLLHRWKALTPLHRR